jgi:hypothetical protein
MIVNEEQEYYGCKQYASVHWPPPSDAVDECGVLDVMRSLQEWYRYGASI